MARSAPELNLLAVSSVFFVWVFSQRRARQRRLRRTRVSSTIKPRCDAARSSHPAHIHLPFPAHSRSSDLRSIPGELQDHQRSSPRGRSRRGVGTRLRVRRPSSFGPVILGVPPRIGRVRRGRSSTRGRRRLVSVVDVARREVRGVRTRLYTRNARPRRALRRERSSGEKPKDPPFSSPAVPADSPSPYHQHIVARQKQHQTKARCLPPERLYTALSPSPSAVSSAWAWPSAPESP